MVGVPLERAPTFLAFLPKNFALALLELGPLFLRVGPKEGI